MVPSEKVNGSQGNVHVQALTSTALVLTVQPAHPATRLGGSMGPNSFSMAIARDNIRPSLPWGAANCSPAGMPCASKPMGNARAAGQEAEQGQHMQFWAIMRKGVCAWMAAVRQEWVSG